MLLAGPNKLPGLWFGWLCDFGLVVVFWFWFVVLLCWVVLCWFSFCVVCFLWCWGVFLVCVCLGGWGWGGGVGEPKKAKAAGMFFLVEYFGPHSPRICASIVIYQVIIGYVAKSCHRCRCVWSILFCGVSSVLVVCL